jgi:putative flippase GtrA
MEEKISTFHKRNLIIWGAIFTGVIALTVVAYILNENKSFEALPQAHQMNQILFIIAIVLAGAILLFKRSNFVPSKVASRISQPDVGENKLEYLLPRLLRNYFIVWTLAEAIALIGFINFVFTADFSSYLIFAVVSAYSLLINIPSEGFIYKCLNLTEG